MTWKNALKNTRTWKPHLLFGTDTDIQERLTSSLRSFWGGRGERAALPGANDTSRNIAREIGGRSTNEWPSALVITISTLPGTCGTLAEQDYEL